MGCGGIGEGSTDLSLTARGDSYQLLPRSVMGMLWLQTHFETHTWDLICTGAVRLKPDSCDRLCRDAIAADLVVARIPAVAPTSAGGASAG